MYAWCIVASASLLGRKYVGCADANCQVLHYVLQSCNADTMVKISLGDKAQLGVHSVWEAHMWVYILVTAAKGPLASAPMTTDLRLLALPLLAPLAIRFEIRLAGNGVARNARPVSMHNATAP